MNLCEISVGMAGDVEIIARFQVDMAMESEGLSLDHARVSRGVAAVVDDGCKGCYLVARIGGEAVGCLMLTREWSDWNSCWYWWVQSVYVVPAYRNRGVFKAMYNKVQEMAAIEGVRQIRLYVDKDNLAAQSVYGKLGMAECHYLMYEKEL